MDEVAHGNVSEHMAEIKRAKPEIVIMDPVQAACRMCRKKDLHT